MLFKDLNIQCNSFMFIYLIEVIIKFSVVIKGCHKMTLVGILVVMKDNKEEFIFQLFFIISNIKKEYQFELF